MRSDLLVAAALLCAACSSSAEPRPAGSDASEKAEAPEPARQPTPPVASADAQPPETAAEAPEPDTGDATESAAKAGALRESLGEAASVVERATDVEIARLRVIAALHAQVGRLKSDTTIAGYPIEGASRPLDQGTRTQLVDTLLDDSNYQWGFARRCANDYLIGLRFTTAAAKVEFALGMPCEQAFFVFTADDGVTSTGQIMTTAAAQRILDAAGAAGLP
ncbi:MAG: hypothetical protein KC486_13010 [Myxococcales bacterium]|nr:hypothetical protein [Myxococcales bacterium]